VKFDPDQWVQLAKHAGMRHLVFTTKHHDGFCNFDCHLTDYKITSPQSPYSKDVVRLLSTPASAAASIGESTIPGPTGITPIGATAKLTPGTSNTCTAKSASS
jgi:hypothetical protein